MRVAEPNLVLLSVARDFLVGERVLIPDAEKLLPALDKLRHVVPKERKRRISDDDVGLLEQVDAFLAAKVAVGFELARLIFARLGRRDLACSPLYSK
jgi:hypothetical protein